MYIYIYKNIYRWDKCVVQQYAKKNMMLLDDLVLKDQPLILGGHAKLPHRFVKVSYVGVQMERSIESQDLEDN